MHHVYTTPGFVIGSRSYKEAGKFFYIFTRDLGMIGAAAQGVRLNQSKLRYHLNDYSLSLFSVVRGKEIWRITGAKEISEEEVIKKDSENKKLHARILALLKRLLPGEEKNEPLFEIIKAFHEFLGANILDKEKRELVESLTVLRMLHSLGYVSHNDLFTDLLDRSSFEENFLIKVKESKALIIKEINSALQESQL